QLWPHLQAKAGSLTHDAAHKRRPLGRLVLDSLAVAALSVDPRARIGYCLLAVNDNAHHAADSGTSSSKTRGADSGCYSRISVTSGKLVARFGMMPPSLTMYVLPSSR